jgi:hypothetical protein
MDMIFTETDWQLYFRLFCYELMLGIEVDGYSHEFWKSIKGWVKENRMNELGLLFWDFSDEQILKDMENVIRLLSLYFWVWKHTPAPLKRERSIRKKFWFNFQNYW